MKKWEARLFTMEEWRSREYIEANTAEEAHQIAYQMMLKPNSIIDEDFEEAGCLGYSEDSLSVSLVEDNNKTEAR